MRIPASVLALALCGASSGLSAQILINEIHLSPATGNDTQWIEIIHLGKTTHDLSNWSLFQGTKTANKPQTYWFGFPSKTRLPAKAIMRIHWGAAITGNSNPLDIETGNSTKNFLFGLGFEPLDPKKGALALLNTNLNAKMNLSTSFEDWVSWGESGFKKEDLAIKAKLWTANQFIPAPDKKQSIALASYLQAEPTPVSAYFLDHTPTPFSGNHEGLFSTTFNTKSCARGAATLAQLGFAGVPTDGNEDFAFTVDNTRLPVFREVVFLLINKSAANFQNPELFIGCPVLVKSVATSLLLGPFNVTFNTTRLPAPLNVPGAGGTWLDFQVFVGSFSSLDFSLSNLLELQIGR